MQTFLPFPDYKKSMECLDKSRLGNQVWREGITLLRGGWKNHPACKMWKGHEYHLGCYLLAGLEVLQERNKKQYDEIYQKIINEMMKYSNTGAPSWLGDEKFHASHRSNLLRKAKEALIKSRNETRLKKQQKYLDVYNWYTKLGWKEADNLPYMWPV